MVGLQALTALVVGQRAGRRRPVVVFVYSAE